MNLVVAIVFLLTLDGFVVAYSIRQQMRQVKKTVPGTIPNASGLYGT